MERESAIKRGNILAFASMELMRKIGKDEPLAIYILEAWAL